MKVEQLHFTFTPSLEPFQYEAGGVVVSDWPQGAKVVDVVAHSLPAPPEVTWLIEAKDYRVITNPPTPTRIGNLAQTVEAKARDTINALPVVAKSATHPAAAAHAAVAASSQARRLVFHLEPHPPGGGHSHLFPAGLSASVHQKLKQLVRDIDPNPLVLNIARTPAAGVPWTVA